MPTADTSGRGLRPAHQLLTDQVRRNPDGAAIRGDGIHVSYVELHDRASVLAARLARVGVRSDDVVGVLVDKTVPDFVVAAYAAWRCGAVYLPIDPRTPPPQVRRMLDGIRPAALVGTAALASPYADLTPATVLTDVPDVEASVRGPSRDADPLVDRLAYIVHTSGSTGTPKPVAMSHRALVSLFLGWRECYELDTRPPRWLQAASPSFDVHIGDMARALLSGGTLVLCATESLLDPSELAALIVRESVECMDLTPTVVTLLADHLDHAGQRLPSLRLIICGGEQMMTTDYRRWRRALGPDVRIVNAYGVSEGGVESTLVDVTEEILDEDMVPIGYPLPGAAVAVLDEGLRPVPLGRVGELYIAGDRVADGYYRRPDLTRERFPDPVLGLPGPRMYRTGDLVRQRPDGALVFLGRGDDEVKIRGIRVLLGSVEAVLLEHPRVRQAVAVRTDRGGEDTLVAHVVLDDRGVTDGGAAWLREDMAARVAAAMVPAHIVLHERLPLNRSGKVDRKHLAAEWSTVAAAVPATVAPGSVAERAVSDAWTRVLGRPPRNRAENLFAAGGTSLTVARLVSLLHGSVGGDLSVASVFAAPTFAGIADLVAGAVRSSHAAGPSRGAEGNTTAPLAPGQRGLWLLHHLRGDDVAYHLPTVLRLDGPLDVAALRRALDTLIERHDALRTAIVDGWDGPTLRVAEPMAFPLRTHTDRGAVDELIAEPFDLTRAPLIRGALIRYANDRHELVLVVHHLVFDDWSERVLVRELGALYSSYVSGLPAPLPALPVSHLDVARWRAARLAGRRHSAYWRTVLADLPPSLDLPAVAANDERAAPFTVSRTLPADLSEQLRVTASRFGTTPYVVLLAAFGILLRRWSGRGDLVVGAPFGHRDRPETQDLVGFLVSTLPLRLSIADDATFAEVIVAAHEVLTGAVANAEVSFDQLAHDAGHTARTDPMFRVWFNWLGSPAEPPAMTGLETELEHLTVPGALFDLSIYVTDARAGLLLDLVADPTVLDVRYLPDFLRQYVRLIEHLCATPEAPAARTSLAVGVAEVAARDLTRPTDPVLSTLAEVGNARGDAVAISSGDGPTTYTQLYRTAGAVATALRGAGVRDGDVVAVLAGREPRLVPAMVGILGAGAAFTLLDRDHPPARLAAQVREAGARIGLTLDDAASGDLAALCPQWICWPEGEGRPLPLACPDRMYVTFTSGTTGAPKPVVGELEPMANFLSWYPERLGIGHTDRFAMLSGIGHDPLLRDVFVPLWTGATICVPPAELLRRSADLLAWLAAERVTVVHLTPALARMLAIPDSPPVPDVRLVVCGGDAMVAGDVARIRRWASASLIVNVYGTTETPQVVSLYEVEQVPGDRIPVGSSAPGAELLVVDGTGRPTAVGEVGGIEVRGPYLAAGEADTVPGHRRFATGDLGRRGPDGAVTVLGRADDQVQVRGFRVELAEIDRVVREQPGVTDAATRATPGPDGENQLVTFVVATEAGTRSLGTRLRSCLPAHLVPSRIVPVKLIALTPNGKPDRAALRPPPLAPVERTPPSSDLERTVASIWRTVLSRTEIGVDQNFYDLGATSLLLTRAHVALQAAIGRTVPITALFEHTTIRRLAAYLAGAAPAGRSTRVSTNRR